MFLSHVTTHIFSSLFSFLIGCLLFALTQKTFSALFKMWTFFAAIHRRFHYFSLSLLISIAWIWRTFHAFAPSTPCTHLTITSRSLLWAYINIFIFLESHIICYIKNINIHCFRHFLVSFRFVGHSSPPNFGSAKILRILISSPSCPQTLAKKYFHFYLTVFLIKKLKNLNKPEQFDQSLHSDIRQFIGYNMTFERDLLLCMIAFQYYKKIIKSIISQKAMFFPLAEKGFELFFCTMKPNVNANTKYKHKPRFSFYLVVKVIFTFSCEIFIKICTRLHTLFVSNKIILIATASFLKHWV